jgi:hypothetical protein
MSSKTLFTILSELGPVIVKTGSGCKGSPYQYSLASQASVTDDLAGDGPRFIEEMQQVLTG